MTKPQSMIDKSNKLWKWKKASKKTKEQYKKLTGLEAQEIGIMTDDAYDLLSKIYDKTTE